jgi:PAS domain S-box-containing protein
MIPIKNERQVTAVMQISTDITEQKRAVDDLKKAHEQLEQRVVERTAELSTANDQLRIEINERKQAEGALRESEEKFRNLAEQSPNMIFINKRGKVAYANRQCEEVMGYTREELYAPDFDFFVLIAPEYVDLVKMNMARHFRGEPVTPYEYGLVTKNGERLETILATRLIQYENDTAIIGTVTDITKRKQIEKERDELIEELQDLLAEIKTLGGLLPMCAKCKKIRDDKGYWHQVESYVEKHSQARFSHGLCEDCVGKLYSDTNWYKKEE